MNPLYLIIPFFPLSCVAMAMGIATFCDIFDIEWTSGMIGKTLDVLSGLAIIGSFVFIGSTIYVAWITILIK